MFVYCLNNPVNYSDNSGNSPERIRELEAQLQVIKNDIVNNINTKYNLKDAYTIRYEIMMLQTAHPVGGESVGATYPGHGVNALDFRADLGTAVRATMAGEVVAICMNYSNSQTWNPVTGVGDITVSSGEATYGNYIDIVTWDGTRIRYAHVLQESGNFVSIGQKVNAGDQIGLVGQVGAATGPHLHFETFGGNVND